MFSRYGFDSHTVADHAMADAVKAGRNCVECLLTDGDDPHGQWGDTPTTRLWRAQLSSQVLTKFNRREWIRFSTLIPQDWKVVQPGEFRANGTQDEQCVLFGMHSTGPEIAQMTLVAIGDRYVWFFLGSLIWQGPIEAEQWDDWVVDVKWHNDPNAGHLFIYRNGIQIYGSQWCATLQRQDQQNYLKIGLYLWRRWPNDVKYRRCFFKI